MNSSKLQKIDVIESLVILIVLLRFCYPLNSLLGSPVNYIVYYSLSCLFLLLVFMYVKNYLSKFIYYLWIPLFMILMIVIRSLYAQNIKIGFYDPLKIAISIINLILAISIYIYLREKSTRFQKKVIWTMTISIMVTIIYSLYYITYVDFLAVRNETSVDLGVADFSLVYATIFFAILLLVNLKITNKRSFHLNLFVIITYIITLIFVIKANFMTALILFLFTSLIVILPKKIKQVSLILSVFLLFMLYIFRTTVGNLVFKLASMDVFSWVIQEKLIAISQYFLGISMELDTFGSRIAVIKSTLGSFYKSPLIGISYSEYNQITIGGHSQWFDDIARFGILGILLWLLFYIILYRYTKLNIQNKIDQSAINISWFVFMILGFFNPNMMSTVTMLVFTIVPFSSSLHYQHGENKNGSKDRKNKNICSNVNI